MIKMSSDESNDEFQCSECDFKCTSEIDIMQHSTIHQCPNTDNDDVLDISHYGKFIKDDPNENDNVNLQAKFSSKEAIVSCTKLADTSKTNELGTYQYKVNRESNSFNIIATAEVHKEHELGNNMIKLEDIDIKQENLPNYSSHQINEYEIIHPDQNSLSLKPSNNSPINGRITRHKAYDKNLYTEYDVVDESESLLNQSKQLQNNMGLTNSSQGVCIRPKKAAYADIDATKLKFSKRKSKLKPDQITLEMDLDNKGIYIPDGWHRKLYVSTSSDGHKLEMYRVKYISPEGQRFGSKFDVYSYLSQFDNIKEKQINVEEMNFSSGNTNRLSSKKRCQSSQGQEKTIKKKYSMKQKVYERICRTFEKD
ncbi:unnamed protein product, partial [Meganyctiphanes norvegica]